MGKKISKYLSGAFFAVILSACVSPRQNMQIEHMVWDNPSTVVLAEIEGLDRPQFIKDGPQGILDVVVNHVITADAADAVQKTNIESIINKHYITAFGQSFRDKNFKVLHKEQLLYRRHLKQNDSSNHKLAPYHFSQLALDYPDAQYALVLDPQFFGVVRKYYGFIPLESPKPKIWAWLYLVDLKSNAIVGFYSQALKTTVPGDWDGGVFYSNLTNCVQDTIAKFLQNAHSYFFPKNGSN